MIGRTKNRDRAGGDADEIGYDAIDKFGADTLYSPVVKMVWLGFPQNSKVANKPSEVNIFNMLPRIVVAQLAGQTQPRGLNRNISRRIILRPGNSSMGGT